VLGRDNSSLCVGGWSPSNCANGRCSLAVQRYGPSTFQLAGAFRCYQLSRLFVERESMGLMLAAIREGEAGARWTSCERVRLLDEPVWLAEKHGGAGRNKRLLSGSTSIAPGMSLRESLSCGATTGVLPVSAKFCGSALASEFLAEWSGTGLGVSEYCSQFFRESGDSGVNSWSRIRLCYVGLARCYQLGQAVASVSSGYRTLVSACGTNPESGSEVVKICRFQLARKHDASRECYWYVRLPARVRQADSRCPTQRRPPVQKCKTSERRTRTFASGTERQT